MYFFFKLIFQTVGLLWLAFTCLVRAAEKMTAPAERELANSENDDQNDQQELKSGDDVIGFYRILDADGYQRTVKYKSDPAVNGFTVEVVREPVNGDAAVPVPTHIKTVVKPAIVTVVTPAPVIVLPPFAPAVHPLSPAVAPYHFGGSAGYVYNYQPYTYPYQGYQGYPYSYSPFSYGQYPYISLYQYSSPSSTAPIVKK